MRTLLLLAAATLANNLPAQTRLEFEVASVRASGPSSQECFGKSLGVGTPNPTRLHYGCYSLVAVIRDAYDVESYRLAGIEKAEGIFTEIAATMPAGTTKAEMQQMLQNLLAERFHLKVRRENREATVYELSLEKGGHKLKERFDDPPQGDAPSLNGLQPGADGMPAFPAVAGRITGGFGTPTKSRAIGSNVPIRELAAYLEPRLRAPVVDATGLQGRYDFQLDFLDPIYDTIPSPEAPPEERFPPIPSALSSQLGLRLEKTKGSVGYVVIESVDKVPTEN